MSKKKLYKSRKNKMIGGVCGGLAEYFNMDPTIVRIIEAILCILKGAGLIIYLIAVIVMPYDDEDFGEDDTENLKSANIDPDEDKKTSSKSKKKNSLSWDTACMTAEVYGKSKYPSFSLHYIGGLISNQQYDDGSYMIKADCTYRNAYGVKIDSVCEAKVAGTDKNPKVTSFFVYD